MYCVLVKKFLSRAFIYSCLLVRVCARLYHTYALLLKQSVTRCSHSWYPNCKSEVGGGGGLI